jgi:hypothetical protein
MERVDGRKVTDPQAVPAWRRPAMFRSIVRGLLSQVIFSRDESVLFHVTRTPATCWPPPTGGWQSWTGALRGN